MKVDNIKKPILIITYGIILYFIVNNLNTFLDYINQGLKVLTPVIMGMVLAFIVNLFLRFYEMKVFDSIFKKSKEKAAKFKRPVCVIVSYISFAAIIALIAVFIFPRISESLSTLKGNVPAYINSISQFLYNLTLEYQFTDDIWNKITENFGLIITNTSQFLNTALPKIFDVTKTVTSSVFSLFLGIVFSFYLLKHYNKHNKPNCHYRIFKQNQNRTRNRSYKRSNNRNNTCQADNDAYKRSIRHPEYTHSYIA